jgi:hypothetical protein
MIMTIYNQYSNIELASPVYSHNCETCCEYPVERTDTDSTMKIDFRFNRDQNEPRGILVYTIQRKEAMKTDHQSSISTIYTKVMEEASKKMKLVVAWKVEHFRRPKVRIVSVEYDNELILDEDKLAQLYDKVYNIPSGHDSSRYTWLICDNAALLVEYEVARKGDLELKITISEGLINQGIRPMWIDSTR